MQTIIQRLAEFDSMDLQVIEKYIDRHNFNIRCCAPGIIQSFDKEKQTVTVQLAIKDLVTINKRQGGELQSLQIPILGDVPIVVQRAGEFSITLPIKKGNECLVFFADSCIDSWWQNGCSEDEKGKAQAQEPMSARRHDLSDGFAVLGPWSQKRVLNNYNADDLEIRSEDGKTVIRVKNGEINILYDSTLLTVKNGIVEIVSDSVKLGASTGLQKLIDTRLITLFNAHTHPYSEGTTSAPTVPLIEANCATTKTEAV
jgi:hypothetical protein